MMLQVDQIKQSSNAVEINVVQENGQTLTLKNLSDLMNVYNIKQSIKDQLGCPIDSLILKIGNHLLQDTLPIKQVPSDDSFRFPEKSGQSQGKKRLLSLRLCQRQFNLKVYIINSGEFKEVTMILHSSISVFALKQQIQALTRISLCEQVLVYNKQQLKDEKFLFNYIPLTPFLEEEFEKEQFDPDKLNLEIIEEELVKPSSLSQLPTYSINLLVTKVNPSSKKLSINMDFTFNALRNVKRVGWKEDAPWFREISDGLSWLGYCINKECTAYRQLFVLNRGYGKFSLSKEARELCCPVCTLKNYEIRNVGFVNSEWAISGKLMHNSLARVTADGKTYDGKLYTFKETNYLKVFEQLEIQVRKIKESKILNNSQIYSEVSSSVSQSVEGVNVEEKKEQPQNPISEVKPQQQLIFEEAQKPEQELQQQQSLIQSRRKEINHKRNAHSVNPQNPQWFKIPSCQSCCVDDTIQESSKCIIV